MELPVQWTLDDAAWLAHPSDPAGMIAVWSAELAAARREARAVTLTIHPEVAGLSHRIDAVRRQLAEHAAVGVPMVAHGTVAGSVG